MKRIAKKMLGYITTVCLIVSSLSIARTEIPVVYGADGYVATKAMTHSHTAETGGCYIPVYHSHEGSSTANSGCYTTGIACGGTITTRSVTGSCGKPLGSESFAYKASTGDEIWEASCSAGHNNRYTKGYKPGYCQQSVPSTQYYCPVCNKVYTGAGTCTAITSYGLSCGMTEETVIGHNLSCPYTESDQVISVGIEKEVSGASYKLKGVVISKESIITEVGFTWDTTESLSCSVTSNRVYVCTVTYLERGESRSFSISYEVTDYDTTPPTISSVEKNTAAVTNGSVTITVNATDTSGIAGYSINGTTYETTNQFVLQANGKYTVYVKDGVGNVANTQVTIDNIDKVSPSVTVTSSKTTPTNKSVTLTAAATEKYTSGYNTGLGSSVAYNWQSTGNGSKTYSASANGTYTVVVTDAAGNQAESTYTVDNIDTVKPVITAVTPSTTAWSNRDVVITVTATDSQSSGYAKEKGVAYSIDGTTYGSTNAFSVTGNGTYTLYAKDKAGNISTKNITVSNIDKTLPTITSFTADTTDWTNGTVTLTVSATDDESGVSGYSFDGMNYSAVKSQTVSENGTYTVYVKDNAGNISTATCLVSNIDTAAPVVTNGTFTPGTHTKDNVTYEIALGSDASGILYPITLQKKNNSGVYEDIATSNNTKFILDDNGEYKIVIPDNAGNVGYWNFELTLIDRTAPVIDSFTASTTDWTNGNVILTVNAHDEASSGGTASGLAQEAYSFDGGNTFGSVKTLSVTQNGVYTVHVKDAAGNITSTSIEITNIDKTAPLISSFNTDVSSWTNRSLDLTVVAEDDSSGIAGYSFDGTNYSDKKVLTVYGNGTYTVYVKDNAGNVSSQTCTVTNIDTKAPSIDSVTYSETDWTRDNIGLTVVLHDDDSDIKYPVVCKYYSDTTKKNLIGTLNSYDNTFTLDQNCCFEIIASDVAGNTTVNTFSISNIDRTAPSITSKEPNITDWTNQNVTVTVTATDAQSGISGYSFDGTNFSLDNTYTFMENGEVTVYIKDAVGNVATDIISVTNIERVPPTLTLKQNTTQATNGSVVITAKATDTSGIAKVGNDTDYTESDTFTFTVTQNGNYRFYAFDNAGNRKESYITVSNIDTISPVINSVVKQPAAETNQNVVLKAVATKDYSDGYDISLGSAIYYKWGNGSYGSTENKTYEVAANGKYTVYVKDYVGNEVSQEVTVNSIDKEKPVIDSFEKSTEDYTNENIEVSVIAHDVQTEGYVGKTGLTYSNDGTNFSEDNTFIITENGTYTFYVKDAVGNIQTGEYTVGNIDRTLPEITSFVVEDNSWTNGLVTLVATGYDDRSGIAGYSFDGITYTLTNETTVNTNGVYTVYVKDGAGNVNSKDITVTNIDTDSPVIDNVVPSTTTWTNRDIILEIVSHDDASGVAYPIEYKCYADDTKAEQLLTSSSENNFIRISQNAYVEMCVKDAAGNTSVTGITISNIDRQDPVISLIEKNTGDWTNENVVLTVNASDNSGCVMKYSIDGSVYGTDNTFAVSRNGEYTLYVMDEAGNTVSGSISVSNIDKNSPIIESFYADRTAWTNRSIKLTVAASDGESGIIGYSFDGVTYSSNNEFTVTGNGVYTVYVKDIAGNVAETTCNVNNIDITAPYISSGIFSPDGFTREDVEYFVTPSDDMSGVVYPLVLMKKNKSDAFDTLSASTTNKFILRDNGEYKIAVTDAAGNVGYWKFSLTSIDRSAPVVDSLTADKTQWTNTDVTITVLAHDTASNSGTASGIAEAGYSFDGLPFSSSNTYTVSTNGIYSVTVKDNVGNETTEQIEISNIDKTSPIISVSADIVTATNQSVTITATASDTSGISKIGPEDNLKTGDTYELTVTENGTYKFVAYDNAGNVGEAEIAINNIDTNNPVITAVTKSITEETDQDVILTCEAVKTTSNGYNTDLGTEMYYRWDNAVYGGAGENRSLRVTRNGQHTVYVKDHVGNEVDQSVTVDNIDKDAPVINDVIKSTEDFVNDCVTVTVMAQDLVPDGYIGNTSVFYSFDGAAYTSVNSCVYTENGTYKVCVKDHVGNISEQLFTINNIEKTAPDIVITPLITQGVNHAYTVEITITDDASGIAGYIMNGQDVSVDGDLAITDTFEVAENGTYTVSCMDKAGNTSEKSITISNFDREDPVISEVVMSTTDPTNNPIEITVNAQDNYNDNLTYKLNNVTINGSSFTVDENGIYIISVIDEAGNITETQCEIRNYDNLLPEISVSTAKQGDTVMVVINADDVVPDGYNKDVDVEYSFNGSVYSDRTDYIVTENGSYEIKARDLAGNEAIRTLIVTEITRPDSGITVFQKSSNNWTGEDVTVLFDGNIEDVEIVTETGTETNKKSPKRSITFDKNGVYKLLLKFVDGSESVVDILIDNIDKVAPIITQIISSEDYTSDVLKIEIDAKDDGSGIESFTFDGGLTWQDDNSYILTDDANLEIAVRDACGNISEYQTMVNSSGNSGNEDINEDMENHKTSTNTTVNKILYIVTGCLVLIFVSTLFIFVKRKRKED